MNVWDIVIILILVIVVVLAINSMRKNKGTGCSGCTKENCAFRRNN